jgi:transcription elongation factor Elf1
MSFEDRSLALYCSLGRKVICHYEKSFTKHFKCAFCNQKVEDHDERLRLCAQHYDEFIDKIEERLSS